MKYFKRNSVPLEEISPGIGEMAYDEFGNYIEIDAFGDSAILKMSVLNEGELITNFENTEYDNHTALRTFWILSDKKLKGYEISNSTAR